MTSMSILNEESTEVDQWTTFHHFQSLPEELRVKIWKLAAFPRIVQIETFKDDFDVLCVTSPTPYPSVMQVCRESRRYAPYKQAFTIGSQARYTWINFENDMIALSDNNLKDPALEAHRMDIQRLRFTTGGQMEYDNFYQRGAWRLEQFTLLEHLDIVTDCVMLWASSIDDIPWGSCSRDNVRFIDATSGFVLTGAEGLAMISDLEDEEEGEDEDDDDDDDKDLALVTDDQGAPNE